MRKTASLAVLISLAFSGVAVAADGAPQHRDVARSAVQACKTERSSDRAAFKTRYANHNGKRAFRRCVAQHVRGAIKTCRAERKSDKAAFRTKYANQHGKRAARRCVSQHSGDALAPAPQAPASQM